MGREVRKVPKDWKHPKSLDGRYIPLYPRSYFEEGEKEEYYMPNWEENECTHFQMYETCTEGTPISPPMSTPEDLAHYLADTKASAFGSDTATFEQWLAMIHQRWVPSMVFNGTLMNGVEAVSKNHRG